MYASSVLGVPLYQYFYIFKFLKRRLASGLCKGPARPWQSTKATWLLWIQTLRFAPPRMLRPPCIVSRKRTVLFSDASKSGWGGFFIDDAKSAIVADSWNESAHKKPIFILEAWAVRNVLWHFRTRIANTHVTVFVDNTTVLSACRKRRSTAFILNEICAWLEDFKADFNISVELLYVNSADNLADAPSRLFESPNQQLPSGTWLETSEARCPAE
jgi:hypothetical protein